jgi:HEAT repeat protein
MARESRGTRPPQPSTRELLARLASNNREEGLQAAWWLGEQGVPDSAVRSGLARALEDPDPDVRGSAAEALGRLGCLDAAAVSLLPPFLEGEKDPTVRARTVYGIGRAGAAAAALVPVLLRLTREDTTHAYDTALWALGEIGECAQEVVPTLAAGLLKPHSDQRWVAAKALGRFGPAAAGAADALRLALRDDHPFVSEMAAWALGETGQAVPGAMEPLRQLAQSPLPNLRREAGLALKAFYSRESGGAPEVKQGVQAPRPAARTKPSLAAFLPGLEEGSSSSAADAAFLLGELAGAAAEAVFALVERVERPPMEVRRAVVGALGKIAAVVPGAAEALVAAVSDAPAELLAAFDWALGLAGPYAAAAIPVVRRQLRRFSGVAHLDLEVRYHAAWALARMAGEDPQVVSELVLCLDDPDSDVRAIAAENLGFLSAEHASGALRRSLEDTHGIVRHRAAWALARIARVHGDRSRATQGG